MRLGSMGMREPYQDVADVDGLRALGFAAARLLVTAAFALGRGLFAALFVVFPRGALVALKTAG